MAEKYYQVKGAIPGDIYYKSIDSCLFVGSSACDWNCTIREVEADEVFAEPSDDDAVRIDSVLSSKDLTPDEYFPMINPGKDSKGFGNTGPDNIGLYNSGAHNRGTCCAGDWNNTDFSGGCFCTVQPKIWMFNRPTDYTLDEWRASDAASLLEIMYHEHNGDRQGWWDTLPSEEKQEILNMPNFDAKIFQKCTGINVKGGK